MFHGNVGVGAPSGIKQIISEN
jgi:hypothetical protein